jgi:hypothetical protein
MNSIHNHCGVVSSTLVVVILFTAPVRDQCWAFKVKLKMITGNVLRCGIRVSTGQFLGLITSTELSHSLQIVVHTILATRMHRELWRAATHQEASSIGDISVVVFVSPLLEAHD